MKIGAFKSWVLCFAVVPLMLLATYIVELIGGSPPTLSFSRPLEIGNIDLAGDSTGSEMVPKAGTLFVSGWAADTTSGAPVQSVTVYVDGKSIGRAMLGGARPDVVQVYGRSDYADSGWNFGSSAGALSVGPHSVTATVAGPSGTAQLGSTKAITIAAQTGGQR